MRDDRPDNWEYRALQKRNEAMMRLEWARMLSAAAPGLAALIAAVAALIFVLKVF